MKMSPCVSPRTSEEVPFVSVVIPVYNRQDFVSVCLASLCSQTYPLERYEILLVDDGSTDGTSERAREMLRGWPGAFQIIEKANEGPASARNAGIKASQADVIAFIDSDCVAEASWLEQLVETLVASDADGVGGPLVNIVPKGWVAQYLDAASFFRHRVRHGQVDYLLTANVAFRRSVLVSVNGFSQYKGVWGEDADLSFRLIQEGYTLVLAEQGIVTHYGTPVSLRGLVKDLYHYGYGNSVLSRNWKNGRTPEMELLRHGGAVALSPFLALSYAQQVSIWLALTFLPLIVIEHSAFICGLITGIARRNKYRAMSS